MRVLDMIAGRVHGAVKARDCRIVYNDGTLYIAESLSGTITARPSSEPKRSGGSWLATTPDGDIRFSPPGCGSCKARVKASEVGQMSPEQIVAAGVLADV